MPRKRKGDDLHGWLVLDKPAGLTSTQALGACKRLFTPKKAGHAGTLDPLATGILPIAFGEATKTVPFAMEGAKTYRFTVRWGQSTDTLDSEGDVISTSGTRPSAQDIRHALPRFIGDIQQVPPAFSAIKVDGQRAYDLARAGEVVELEPRTIRVDNLALLDNPSADLAVLEMTCGKGGYVRGVARDLAASLGADGHVAALRRVRVGPFDESDAIPLAKLKEIDNKPGLVACILPIDAVLDDIPAVEITPGEMAHLKQGRPIVLLPHLVERLRAARKPRVIAGEDASRVVVAKLDRVAVALGQMRAGRFEPSRVFQM